MELQPQVDQARNMSIGEHRHCCVTFEIKGFVWEKKTIVSITYENERISMKNSLPYLKCVLRLPCVVPYMGRDFAQTTQSSRPLVCDVTLAVMNRSQTNT